MNYPWSKKHRTAIYFFIGSNSLQIKQHQFDQI